MTRLPGFFILLGIAESISTPPRIITLDNNTGSEGGSTVLICVTEGYPPATMTFQKAGKLPYATGANEGGRIIIERLSDYALKLSIFRLRPTDTANYTCRADNHRGTFFRNGTITVQFPPRFAADHVTEYYIGVGSRRNLTCHAEGEPEPTVKWFRHNVELGSNDTYEVYREGCMSRLEVYVQEGDQPWVYGEYQCRAIAVGGRYWKELNITVECARPDGDYNVQQYICDATGSYSTVPKLDCLLGVLTCAAILRALLALELL